MLHLSQSPRTNVALWRYLSDWSGALDFEDHSQVKLEHNAEKYPWKSTYLGFYTDFSQLGI